MRGVEHGVSPIEGPPGMIQRQISQKLLRADPGPADEQTAEMERTECRSISNLVKPRLPAKVPSDIGERAFDPGEILRFLLCRLEDYLLLRDLIPPSAGPGFLPAHTDIVRCPVRKHSFRYRSCDRQTRVPMQPTR